MGFLKISLEVVYKHLHNNSETLFMKRCTFVCVEFVTGKCKKPQDVAKIPNWSEYVLEEGMVFSNGKLCIFADVSKQASRRMLQYKSAMT